MKTLASAAALSGLLLITPAALASPESDQEKLSYSIGVTLGQSLSQDIQELDVDAFTQAVKDIYAGDDLQMSQEEMAQALTKYQEEMMAEQQAAAQQAAEANRSKSEEFLAGNAEKEGVETTDSGLQYKVLESGDGETPGPKDNVEVHYEGTLVDGTVFDSSYQRGESVEFRVDQVIEGWQQALQMMSVGDVWMVYLPSDLAYGSAGTGGPIGPNEALTFKVELLGVEKAESGE